MGDEKLVSAEEARGLLASIADPETPEQRDAAWDALEAAIIALHARAERAERERDEAIELLEGIPTWGPYRWRDVPDTVRLKLRGYSDQIGRLIKERDAARTILDGEIRARSDRERERDEALSTIEALRSELSGARWTIRKALALLDCGNVEHARRTLAHAVGLDAGPVYGGEE